MLEFIRSAVNEEEAGKYERKQRLNRKGNSKAKKVRELFGFLGDSDDEEVKKNSSKMQKLLMGKDSVLTRQKLSKKHNFKKKKQRKYQEIEQHKQRQK